MSGVKEAYEVRVYSVMNLVGVQQTFGDIREGLHRVPDDVPPGAVHQNGEWDTFEDSDVVTEALGTPLIGWVIVFEEPPLEDYSYYRYPDLREE
ncbi:hypothetical protein [Natrinema salinisoli]|uniref:hypothetical protein n=1 Tax=Natrinema salinisoli TaxID=2878535 RepID=UPI001CF007C0|nr:hypothetical protein [Natrinema salinisoli]